MSDQTFTFEDMKNAFQDGKRYGDGELEISPISRARFLTAFEMWLEDYLTEKAEKSEIEEPYITEVEVDRTLHYNPNYGDDRICECGHPYYRHFDTYERMYPCVCKYCQCFEFKEDDGLMKKFNFYRFNMRTHIEESEPFCTIEATNPDIAEDIFNSTSNEKIFTPDDETFYHIRRAE
jgi:hypothetical protein